MQSGIRESVMGKKFLLVLDDVWDEDHARWQGRMSLLHNGAKGSKLIVTTRSSSVARAMHAVKTRTLDGLSEDDSWTLFKRVAFSPEQEKDSRWTDLGRQIVKKCANVPMAIKSIGSLLFTKSTMEEWESFSKEKLPSLGENGPDSIMPVLKLSYDHLNSNLKQCFAYCSLFPKDHKIDKQELIYLWMAQGYIKLNNVAQSTVEEAGHSYFMELVRRSFFHQIKKDVFGEIKWCKMHDLVHDLAQHVAGEESIILTKTPNEVTFTRHASVGHAIDDDSLAFPAAIFNVRQLRSFLFMCRSSLCRPTLAREFADFKFLRSLSLSDLEIENLPTSIGELKHLRYLDISRNRYKNLPDSITNLLNLCTLNISQCADLEALPTGFRKLINLRHLENKNCFNLKYMPPGFEELASIQRLDEFKAGGIMSKLGTLEGLRLSGVLKILFEDDTNDDWDGVQYWQPPVNLKWLIIFYYKGTRIPKWGNGSQVSPTLTRLLLSRCSKVKCLPPFRHLPNLRSLSLVKMEELQYMEEDDSDALFLPPLEELELLFLPKLVGWCRKDGAATSNDERRSSDAFPALSYLQIYRCLKLEGMPLCPCVERLQLRFVSAELILQLLSTSDSCSSTLKRLEIVDCNGLTSVPGESLTSLSSLVIERCRNVKGVVLAPSHLNVLKKLKIHICPKLELWKEEKAGVDWDSLPSLRTLEVDKVPSRRRLPDCLRNRKADGRLKISD